MSTRTSGMRSAPSNNEDIQVMEPEVLPAEGPQPFYDLAHDFGGGLKQNATWCMVGVVIGVFATVFIMRNNRA